MMRTRLNNITINCMLAALLSALFVSCKDETEEYKEEEYLSSIKRGAIGFSAEHDGFQKPTTRALVENTSTMDMISVLSMKTNDNNATWQKVFDYDTVVIRNVGEYVWEYSNEKEWEDEYNYRFRAFYPIIINKSSDLNNESCDNGGFQFTSPVDGTTTLTLDNYRSAKDPRNNSDLLVSETINRLYSENKIDDPVPLKMNHLLSGVNFNIKKKVGQSLTITSLAIRNHATNASYDGKEWKPNYDFSQSDASQIFTVYPDASSKTPIKNVNWGQLKKGEFVVEYNDVVNLNLSIFSAELFDNSKNPIASDVAEVTDYSKGMLMIPQVLQSQDEEITINLSNGKEVTGTIRHTVEGVIKFYFDGDNNNTYTAIVDLTANGRLNEWEAGKIYTYTIGVYEYQVAVNIDVEDWQKHAYEEELK